MPDIPERFQAIHQEALGARELNFKQFAVGMLLLFGLLLAAVLNDGFQILDIPLIAVPLVLIGLMALLAMRIGLAYALIRHLEES